MKNKYSTLHASLVIAFLLFGIMYKANAVAQGENVNAEKQSTLPDAPEPVKSSSADWRHLEQLTREDTITVKLRGGDTVRCVFDGVNEHELFCVSPYGFNGGREFHFDHAEVDVVRQRHEHRNILLFSLIGAGTGCGYFAAREDSPKTIPRGVDCAIGGGIGALGGSFVGMITRPFIPGRLIYRRNKTP